MPRSPSALLSHSDHCTCFPVCCGLGSWCLELPVAIIVVEYVFLFGRARRKRYLLSYINSLRALYCASFRNQLCWAVGCCALYSLALVLPSPRPRLTPVLLRHSLQLPQILISFCSPHILKDFLSPCRWWGTSPATMTRVWSLPAPAPRIVNENIVNQATGR